MLSSRRRFFAGLVGLAATAAVTAVACTKPPGGDPPGTTTPTGAPAAPPFTGADCGVIAYASGWPTTMPVNLDLGAGKCFQDAWAAGTPARLTTRDQTDGEGGHILIKVWDVLGPGQLRVTVDRRQTIAPLRGVTTQRCTELGTSGNHLQAGNCTDV